MTDLSFAEFIQQTFPNAIVTPLSSTNNEIYKVEDKGSTLTAKRMVDTDVPISYFARCSEILEQALPIPRIERIFFEADGAPFDSIVSEYIEGHDLAAILSEGGALRIPDDRLVEFFARYLAASRRLPPMFEGFGLYKQDGPRYSSHQEFLRAYADKYWRRVRPFVDGEAGERVDHWVTHGLRAASLAPEGFAPIVVDSNLRNFIVTNEGELALLNVPIVGRSTRAHAVAAVAAHLRPFAVREAFLDRLTEGWSLEERSAVAHLEAWTLLGILSFYAVRAPERPSEWRNWGATRSLRDDFLELVASIQTLERPRA
ncbi:MAG TPA: hypothetical protein VGB04_07530 [Allosphingosinicella sp.]|jgi:hypothetical protein